MSYKSILDQHFLFQLKGISRTYLCLPGLNYSLAVQKTQKDASHYSKENALASVDAVYACKLVLYKWNVFRNTLYQGPAEKKKVNPSPLYLINTMALEKSGDRR